MIYFDFESKNNIKDVEKYCNLDNKYEKLEHAINRMNKADNVDTLNHWTMEAIKTVVDIFDIHANVLDWNSMGR